MPIEIRELVIKTTIVDSGPNNAADRTQAVSRKEIEKMKKEIVAQCLEAMKDNLNRQKER